MTTDVKTIEVPVTGMDCAECTQHVQQAVAALPGVKSAASANTLPLAVLGRSLDIKLTADQSPMFKRRRRSFPVLK